jgi:hypothetical protein
MTLSVSQDNGTKTPLEENRKEEMKTTLVNFSLVSLE